MDDKNTPAANTPGVEPNNDVQPSASQQADNSTPYSFDGQAEDTSRLTADTTSPSAAIVPAKKSKKRLVITLIAAALLLLGLGLAYVYWYQNPTKVVSDAFIHALNAKSMTYTGTVTAAGSSKMVVTFNGGAVVDGATVNAKLSYETDGRQYTLDGNGIIDKKNDIYFKVQNIDGLVNNYRRMVPQESQALFDQIIDKIDDKWVKVSSEDLKSFSPDAVKTQECLSDSFKEMQNDAAVRKELIDTYKKHPFITIDKALGAKDGSLGYSLKMNEEAEKAFEKEYRNTTFYKSLVKCDSSFAEESDQLKEDVAGFSPDVRTEVWVDRWSHQITKVTLKQEEDGQTVNMAIEPKFNRPVAIVTPKDATTLEQLQKDIQTLLQSAQQTPATDAAMPQSDPMMQS